MKEKTFYIDTPPIHIGQLSEEDDFQINFDLKKDDFVGVLTIRLDPAHIEWDNHDEEYFPTECNRLIVSVTTELDITEPIFIENIYFLVIEYLTIFFNYLQTELGQYWVDVGSIQDWDLITFLGKTIASHVEYDGLEKFGVPIGGYSKKKKILFSAKRRIYPEKSNGLNVKHISDIRLWFEQRKEPALPRLLLANAKRSLLHGDRKSSSILAITALEQPLEKFIKERCKAKGISKNTLETYDKNHFIADYLKLLLPLVLEPNELTEWLQSSNHRYKINISGNQIIEWAVEFNKARNDAVHRGITPIFETVDKGIFAIETIYEFVNEGN
ncbi:hypothetical protein FBQ81_09065 [Chloroflexi bacterium CFX6]|nr:hypothetical protein [Chloroflexi bacterium CFX6]